MTSGKQLDSAQNPIFERHKIQEAAGTVSSLDILINNAGVARYDDLSDRAALERHLAVNLFGTHSATQAFLPHLTRSRGAIVNNLSASALASLITSPSHDQDSYLLTAAGLAPAP
jgi:NAD(P)-dependent dehydrogenase (short-subunit alcohol dehydrogenase family)